MKNILPLLLTLMSINFAFSQNVNIPDANFKAKLVGNAAININSDTEIQVSEANAFTGQINVRYENISDMTGIESFINITYLNFEYNNVDSIDLSNNLLLTTLKYGSNNLTEIDLSIFNNLNHISIPNCNLQEIDFSSNPLIDTIQIYSTNIDSIDVSNLFDLKYLSIGGNNFTELDISNNDSLIYLNLNLNLNFGNLDSIDISHLPNLTHLYASNNNLSNIDVSNNPLLEVLTIRTNNIDSVDVSNLSNLREFRVGQNNITSLDVTNNPLIELLAFQFLDLDSIDLSNNTALKSLTAYSTDLVSVDLSNNSAFVSMNFYNCPFLEELILSNGNNSNVTYQTFVQCPNLTCIEVDDIVYSTANWTNVDATANFSLNGAAFCIVNIPDANFKANLLANATINTNFDTEIQCTEAAAFTGTITCANSSINDLTGIEAFTNLNSLYCFSNNISALDLSQNTALVNLNCRSNNLDSLDVSLNTALEFFSCHTNNLTELDLSQNIALSTLQCNMNNLNSLNLANGNNSSITNLNFNASNNPNLTCIEVDNVTYSTTNWTSIDAIASFSLNCLPACFVNIPDANFKSYLVGNTAINTNGNTEIECNEASAFNGQINCSNLSITDLTGIEAFTNLNSLFCINNSISSLDVSQNVALIGLSCRGNSIISLDLSQNVALTSLICSNNSISTLDLSQNTALINLLFGDNPISAIDLSQNTALEVLEFPNTSVSTLDVSQNLALEFLDCESNSISTLDLSQNVALTELYCQGNSLTTLNVANANNTNFIEFEATNNPFLTCIEVDNVAYSSTNWINIDATANFSLDCASFCIVNIPDANFKSYLIGNTAINTNGNTEIECSEASAFIGVIDCGNLSISDLTGIESFVNLNELYCYSNSLSSIDISNNTALTLLDCSDNQLISLDVSSNTNLLYFYCGDNQLTNLNVSSNTTLIELSFGDNLLNTIDVSNNTLLEKLICYRNNLTLLDISTNNLLKRIWCFDNQITYITGLTNLPLENFFCYENLISSLNLSSNIALTDLRCNDNDLIGLNLANGFNNNITTFYAFNNPNLICIQVDDTAYSNSNWPNIDLTANYNIDCDFCFPSQQNINASICDGEIYTSPSLNDYTLSGTYKDTISNYCGGDSIIEINLSVLDIQIVNNNGTLEASLGFDTYQWLKDGTSILNETNTSFTPTETGNYSCEASKSACQDISNTINIDFATGLNNLSSIAFKVYPNPTKNIVNIKTAIIIDRLIIKDLNGKKIKTYQANTAIIDLEFLNKGVYILEYVSQGKRGFERVIKQ